MAAEGHANLKLAARWAAGRGRQSGANAVAIFTAVFGFAIPGGARSIAST